MKKILYSAIGAALMLASCQQEANDLPQMGNYPEDGVVRISTQVNAPTTRANTSNYTGTDLSLSIKSGNDRYSYTNIEWTTTDDGTTWTPATPMLWQGGQQSVKIYAYAPFVADVADITAVPVKVDTDQNSNGIDASDLLGFANENFTPYNQLNEKQAVEITFDHILSKLTLTLSFGDQFDGQDLTVSSVKLVGTNTTVSYDATSKTLGDAATPDAIAMMRVGTTHTYTAILVPQTIAAGKPMIDVTLSNGNTYRYNTTGVTFATGMAYTMNMRIGKDEVTLASPVTVAPWGDPEDMEDGDTEVVLPYYKTSLNKFSASAAAKYNEWVVTGDGMIAEDSEFMMALRERTEPLTLTMPDLMIVRGAMFNGCTSLVSIDFPSATVLGSSSLAGCSNLVSISFPKVTSPIDGSIFSGCNSLTSILLPEVTIISLASFRNLTSLQNISLPKAREIGQTTFSGCSNLSEVSLPLVESIGDYAFERCTSLTSIELPKAISMGRNAFAQCSNLLEVSLPEATTIGASVFTMCTSLVSIELPKATGIGNEVFTGCSRLEEVSLPEAITIGHQIFGGSSALVNVSMPKVADLSGNSFSSLNKLVSLDVSQATRVGDQFVAGCENLENINLSNVREVGEFAFSGCAKLAEIRLGSTVSEPINIDSWAFQETTTSNITLYLNANETVDANTWYNWTFKEIIQ